MPQLNTLRLEAFAALIAQGCPPALAAMGAGYGTARARRAAARLAEPRLAARVAELTAPREPAAKTAAGAAPRDQAEAPAPPKIERPPLPPIMSEEEWMTKYAPHLLEKWRASQ